MSGACPWLPPQSPASAPAQSEIQSASAHRPTQEDARRIATEVAEVSEIQRRLVERHPDIKCPDRAAHQYQIVGSTVGLRVAAELPPGFAGVGLFVPGTEHFGVARISTSLGVPNPETSTDFIGIRASFFTTSGQRVDLIGVNIPALPVETHHDNMHFLRSTADGAGPRPLLAHPMSAGNVLARESLYRHLGRARTDRMQAHIGRLLAKVATIGSAYLPFWTGVAEVSGALGKFTLRPRAPATTPRAPHPGEHFLTREWERRQAAGDIEFDLCWMAYLDEQGTSLERFGQPWEESHAQCIGQLVFPRTDLRDKVARQWPALAAEMDANPGFWVPDVSGLPRDPPTMFELVRKLAYELSSNGRDALKSDAFRDAFRTRRIDGALAQELARRVEHKRRIKHIDRAPS